MASWRHQHVHEPEQGDVLHFKSPSHAIYEGCPSGNTVPSTEVFISFDAPVQVVQSRRSSWSRWHKGKRKWVVAKYVAVEFERDGRSLWTNFSRDGEQWLWTHLEMCKYRCLRNKEPSHGSPTTPVRPLPPVSQSCKGNITNLFVHGWYFISLGLPEA